MARKTAAPVEELEAFEEVTDDATDSSEGKLSAKEAATAIGTDARSLRKYLRSQHGLVGQGQRWLIAPDDIPELKAKFDVFSKGAKPKVDKPAKKAAKPKADAPPPDDDDELEDLTDLMPDDDELEDLDDLLDLEDDD